MYLACCQDIGYVACWPMHAVKFFDALLPESRVGASEQRLWVHQEFSSYIADLKRTCAVA